MNWHEFFIKMAELTAMKSKDRSTKIGAVIVGANHEVLGVGFNGFPRGVDDDVDERHGRPAKYAFTEHAERNAIYNAARNGIRTEGAWMYFNTNPYPCQDCARAVIQAGIAVVVGRDMRFPGVSSQWLESLRNARTMMLEAGVRIMVLDDKFIPKAFEGPWDQEELYRLTVPGAMAVQHKRTRLERNFRVIGEITCLNDPVLTDDEFEKLTAEGREIAQKIHDSREPITGDDLNMVPGDKGDEPN